MWTECQTEGRQGNGIDHCCSSCSYVSQMSTEIVALRCWPVKISGCWFIKLGAALSERTPLSRRNVMGGDSRGLQEAASSVSLP